MMSKNGRVCFQWSVYLIDLGETGNNIQEGLRPCICVSNDINNTWSNNVQFIPFTTQDLTALANVPACIIDDEFFQNKTFALDNAAETELEGVMSSSSAGLKRTSFYNPETLKNNHWLHVWAVKATSPMKQAVVFTKDEVGVTSIAVSPESASIIAGQKMKLSAIVTTTGFANKAVLWSVDETSAAAGVKINQSGELEIPSTVAANTEITVTATSIFDTTKKGTKELTITQAQANVDTRSKK